MRVSHDHTSRGNEPYHMAIARTLLVFSTHEVRTPVVSCSPPQHDMHTDEAYWVVSCCLAVERQVQRLNDADVSLVQRQYTF